MFWPLLLLGVPILLASAVHFQIAWWWPASAGIVLGSAQILSYLRLTRSKPLKFFVKSSFGAGAASGVTALILAPWPAGLRLGLGLGIAATALLFQTRRLKSITAVCDACPWQRQWQSCPGFAPLNNYVPGSRGERETGTGPGPPKPWPW